MDRSPAHQKRHRPTRILLAGACAIALAVTSMTMAGSANADRTAATTGSGYHNGYYFACWTDSGNVTMTLGPAGNYRAEWSTANNFVVGKGWNPGTSHTVSYSGTFNVDGIGYLALYGWTTNPLVQYYILDNFGSYNPSSGATRMGSVTTDGGTYDIYRSQRVNQPSIIGIATFYQFWSIRRQQRTGGTITTANHFTAWRNAGLNLGTHNFQIMATEGYRSSGSSSITVAEGSGPPPTTPPTNPPTHTVACT